MSDYIRIKNLTVGYEKQKIVKDISLDIKKGELVTLIGPNGSGKSTILKSISKQLEAISGVVYLGKRKLQEITYKELSRELSVLLTDRIRPEFMTCYDVVALGRYPFTNKLGILTSKDREIIEASMKELSVYSLKDADFMKLSDGQKQRVLLARAICQETEIIVLDEPTSFMDIKYKIELLNFLKKLAKEDKKTIIMSLHEVDLAEKFSDKILCINHNVVSDFGEPEKIFKKEIIKKLFDLDDSAFEVYFSNAKFYD